MTQGVILKYNADTTLYPTNAQVWHAGRDANGDFSPAELDKIFFGNTPAPKGHFVFNAFNRDRDSVSGLSGLTTTDDVDNVRPSTVEFFAGRVWYSGADSKVSSGNVYFSQIFKNKGNVGSCYQEQDPTAEIFNALLDTDGGVIPITGAGEIISLVAIGAGLAVLADNGVWLIKGGDNGFTATTFAVSQLSTNGVIAGTSVVKAGGVAFYWGKSAIYEIGSDQRGITVVNDITTNVISEDYIAIKTSSKRNARGSFNSVDKKVFFLYNTDTTYDGSSFRMKYNRVLIYDMVLKAFYDQSIKELTTNSPYIVGLFETSHAASTNRTENVTVGGVDVTVGGVVVTTTINFPTDNTISSKAITVVPDTTNTITFSEFFRTDFKDWYSKDSVGVDATAYVEASPETLNVPSNMKKATQVTTHFKITETGYIVNPDSSLGLENPSGCLMQARWDWSDNSISGRFGRQQEVYRFSRHYIPSSSSDPFTYGQYVLSTKTSVRGRGRSLSLRFDSEDGKDFNLLGWTTNFTAGK